MAKINSEPVVVAEGQWGSVVCARRRTGPGQAEEFLDELREFYIGPRVNNVTAFVNFAILSQQMAQHGRVSRKRFGPEGDGIFAFKHELRNVQFRFACFQDGSMWVLTHGFQKPGAKKGLGAWPQTQLNRAKTIRAEYFELKVERTSNNGQNTR